MINPYDTIRFALNDAARMLKVAQERSDMPNSCAHLAGTLPGAFAALDALEKAAREPVATVCLVTDRFAHGHCIEAQLQVDRDAQLPVGTKLYAAPPAAMREPTDEECERIYKQWESRSTGARALYQSGRAMFVAVSKVMEGK